MYHNVAQYFKQLNAEFQKELNLSEELSLLQTKHQLSIEAERTEGIVHKIKSMLSDLPVIIALDTLAEKHDEDQNYKDT